MVETATEFGAALGIARLGSAGIVAYGSHLSASAPTAILPAALAAARSILGGAVTVASRLPWHLGAGLLAAARTAFTHGLNDAALAAATVMILAAVLSAAFFRRVPVGTPPGSRPAAQDTDLGRAAAE